MHRAFNQQQQDGMANYQSGVEDRLKGFKMRSDNSDYIQGYKK